MKDITIDIMKSILIGKQLSEEVNWNILLTKSIASNLSSLGYKIKYDKDNENWCAIFHEEILTGIIWSAFPFAICDSKELKTSLERIHPTILIVNVDSLKQSELSFTLPEFNYVKIFLIYDREIDCFSAIDLYNSTNER